jgi:hypothetical protein
MNLKVFGCLCFNSTLSQNRNKLDTRAVKYVFLCFQNGTKGFIVLNLKTRAVSVSRNVVFYEKIFPFKSVQPAHVDTDLHPQPTSESPGFWFDDPPLMDKLRPTVTSLPVQDEETFHNSATNEFPLQLQDAMHFDSGLDDLDLEPSEIDDIVNDDLVRSPVLRE